MFDLEKERELFEAWAYSNKWNTFKVSFMNDDIEKYADDFVEGAWHGWIQSANREGFKLVPVEPTEKMIKVGCKSHGITAANIIYKAMVGAVE